MLSYGNYKRKHCSYSMKRTRKEFKTYCNPKTPKHIRKDRIRNKEHWIYMEEQKTIHTMGIVSSFQSVIAFNVNGSNSPIKILRMAK